MNHFQQTMNKWRADLQQIYVVSIEITHVAHALNEASLKMKILATNGMVQASRAQNRGGRVFTTLAQILSQTPDEISKIIIDLEELFVLLIKNSTESLNTVKMLSQYIEALFYVFTRLNVTREYFNTKHLYNYRKFVSFFNENNLGSVEEHNIKSLLDFYNQKNDEILANIRQSESLLKRAVHKIRQLKTLSLSTRYLGTNISTEAAKYEEGDYFVLLGNDIADLLDGLDNSVKKLESSSFRGQSQLKQLIKEKNRV